MSSSPVTPNPAELSRKGGRKTSTPRASSSFHTPRLFSTPFPSHLLTRSPSSALEVSPSTAPSPSAGSESSLVGKSKFTSSAVVPSQPPPPTPPRPQPLRCSAVIIDTPLLTSPIAPSLSQPLVNVPHDEGVSGWSRDPLVEVGVHFTTLQQLGVLSGGWVVISAARGKTHGGSRLLRHRAVKRIANGENLASWMANSSANGYISGGNNGMNGGGLPKDDASDTCSDDGGSSTGYRDDDGDDDDNDDDGRVGGGSGSDDGGSGGGSDDSRELLAPRLCRAVWSDKAAIGAALLPPGLAFNIGLNGPFGRGSRVWMRKWQLGNGVHPLDRRMSSGSRGINDGGGSRRRRRLSGVLGTTEYDSPTVATQASIARIASPNAIEDGYGVGNWGQLGERGAADVLGGSAGKAFFSAGGRAGSIQEAQLALALKVYFTRPRVLCEGDVLAVPVPVMSDEEVIYANTRRVCCGGGLSHHDKEKEHRRSDGGHASGLPAGGTSYCGKDSEEEVALKDIVRRNGVTLVYFRVMRLSGREGNTGDDTMSVSSCSSNRSNSFDGGVDPADRFKPLPPPPLSSLSTSSSSLLISVRSMVVSAAVTTLMQQGRNTRGLVPCATKCLTFLCHMQGYPLPAPLPPRNERVFREVLDTLAPLAHPLRLRSVSGGGGRNSSGSLGGRVRGSGSSIRPHDFSLLVHGPKGTDKCALLCEAASSLGFHVLQVPMCILATSPSPPTTLRAAFQDALQYSACLLHIVGLRSMAGNERGGHGGPSEADERFASTLLKCMEEINEDAAASAAAAAVWPPTVTTSSPSSSSPGSTVAASSSSSSSACDVVVLLAASTDGPVEELPACLRRCFTHEVKVPLPGERLRLKLLQHHLRGVAIGSEVRSAESLKPLAKRLMGRTSAEIEVLVSQAGVAAVDEECLQAMAKASLQTKTPISSSSSTSSSSVVGRVGQLKEKGRAKGTETVNETDTLAKVTNALAADVCWLDVAETMEAEWRLAGDCGGRGGASLSEAAALYGGICAEDDTNLDGATLTSTSTSTLRRSGKHSPATAVIHLRHLEQAEERMPPPSSTRKIGCPKIPKVHWDDVGGLADVKKEIMDVIELPLKYPHVFVKGVKRRAGILLYGPPGTGKTLVAKAVATECGLPFFSVKGPELLDMYVGESEKNVREAFREAKLSAPSVLFFDEIDSLAPMRGRGADSGGVMDRVVAQLLAEMDGISSGITADGDEGKDDDDDGDDGIDDSDVDVDGGDYHKQQDGRKHGLISKRPSSSSSSAASSKMVFVVGATNRPDLLDPSLMRPGRFDRLLYLGVTSSSTTTTPSLSSGDSKGGGGNANLKVLKAITRKFDWAVESKEEQEALLQEVVDRHIPTTFTGADLSAVASGALQMALKRRVREIEAQVAELNARDLYGPALTTQQLLARLPERELKTRVTLDDMIAAAKGVNPSVSPAELAHYEELRQQFSSSLER